MTKIGFKLPGPSPIVNLSAIEFRLPSAAGQGESRSDGIIMSTAVYRRARAPIPCPAPPPVCDSLTGGLKGRHCPGRSRRGSPSGTGEMSAALRPRGLKLCLLRGRQLRMIGQRRSEPDPRGPAAVLVTVDTRIVPASAADWGVSAETPNSKRIGSLLLAITISVMIGSASQLRTRQISPPKRF